MTESGRSSYLYATIHVGRFEWTFPGPLVLGALAATETLALEVDLSDPDVRTQLVKAAAGRLPLPQALEARMDALLERNCVPKEAVATLHPLLSASGLGLMDARRDGLHIEYAQEFVLTALARERRMPVASLESVRLALLPRDPTEATELVALLLDHIDAGRHRTQYLKLSRAWETSDNETIAGFESWCECTGTAVERALLKRMIDERNPGLAQAIARLHREGARVFAAIGTLHLFGDRSVTELLRGMGFEIERVAFTN